MDVYTERSNIVVLYCEKITGLCKSPIVPMSGYSLLGILSQVFWSKFFCNDNGDNNNTSSGRHLAVCSKQEKPKWLVVSLAGTRFFNNIFGYVLSLHQEEEVNLVKA